MIKRFTAFVSIFLLGMLVQGQVWAWGPTGHRVVGHIAEQHLNKKARKALKKIMGHESLAMASTWADEIKSDHSYDYAKPWHYINVPQGMGFEEAPRAEEDILKAIEEMVAQLKSEESTQEEKQFAVRFLVHLIGDLHQPMHTGYKKDLGGNRVEMKWFGDRTNLHSIWDSKMIDFQKLSYTELSKSINHTNKGEVKEWQNSTVIDWFQESLKLREKAYASADEELSAYRYTYVYYPMVEDRLLKAGVRLAGLLNDILG